MALKAALPSDFLDRYQALSRISALYTKLTAGILGEITRARLPLIFSAWDLISLDVRPPGWAGGGPAMDRQCFHIAWMLWFSLRNGTKPIDYPDYKVEPTEGAQAAMQRLTEMVTGNRGHVNLCEFECFHARERALFGVRDGAVPLSFLSRSDFYLLFAAPSPHAAAIAMTVFVQVGDAWLS